MPDETMLEAKDEHMCLERFSGLLVRDISTKLPVARPCSARVGRGARMDGTFTLQFSWSKAAVSLPGWSGGSPTFEVMTTTGFSWSSSPVSPIAEGASHRCKLIKLPLFGSSYVVVYFITILLSLNGLEASLNMSQSATMTGDFGVSDGHIDCLIRENSTCD